MCLCWIYKWLIVEDTSLFHSAFFFLIVNVLCGRFHPSIHSKHFSLPFPIRLYLCRYIDTHKSSTLPFLHLSGSWNYFVHTETQKIILKLIFILAAPHHYSMVKLGPKKGLTPNKLSTVFLIVSTVSIVML
jgi:hypothetical protein